MIGNNGTCNRNIIQGKYSKNSKTYFYVPLNSKGPMEMDLNPGNFRC